MITLFTGSPGAGKTLSLVHYLSSLPGDRPLYVDGLNGLTLPHTECDASKWHEELPDGAILVIDEVQRVWRPRGSGAKVPDAVAALETHRHHGIDVFMTTQAPALLDANVRNLVGRHVHIRDTGILGRYWYEWPETNTSMAWKSCVNKKRLRLPKKAFSLYKSSSMHTEPVRGVPRSLYVGIVALLVLSVLVYGVWRIINKTQHVAPAPVASAPSGAAAGAPQGPQMVERSPAIDDRVDFIPRVSGKPESAPAYDHLRVIVAMPVVTAGACAGDECHCFTDQGSPVLSSRDCKEFVHTRPFDPYRVKVAASTNEPVQGKPLRSSPVSPPTALPPVSM